MLNTCDLAGYLQLAEKILTDEKQRLQSYLTWDKFDQKLEKEF